MTPILILIFIFILGAIIGSFLNVVIYRLNSGRKIVNDSSMCMSCGHKLKWYELIPILSYFVQGCKCRKCKSRISIQYPIVEILSGLIFVAISVKFFPFLMFSFWLYLAYVSLYLILFSLLVVMFVYDLRHKIIPNKLVFPFIFLSFFSMVMNLVIFGNIFSWIAIFDIFAGIIVALPFALIWLFSKGRLMGLGDAKLMMGIGWMLGISSGAFAIILAFWIGAAVGLLLMAFAKKKIGFKTEVPFAPFLILGVLISFLFGFDLSTLINIFTL